MHFKIRSAQKAIEARALEAEERIQKAHDDDGGAGGGAEDNESSSAAKKLLEPSTHGLSYVRESLVEHSMLAQYSLLMEEELRTSVLEHFVGALTAVWLVIAVWGLVLVI